MSTFVFGDNMVLAGDTIFILAMVIWMSVSVGPWWMGFVILFTSYIINKLHQRFLIEEKSDQLVKMSSQLGIPIPPDIQEQLKKLKSIPWWKFWR